MFRKFKHEKGQSLVEMAVLMPLIILLIAGLLDLGRAFFTYIALSDAAAEGAAYAAIHPMDETQIKERAADSSTGLVVLTPDMVSVDIDELGAGNPVTVTVDYEFQLLMPIMTMFVPKGVIQMQSVAAQPIMGDF